MPTPAPPTKPAPPDLSKLATLTAIQIKFHTNNDDLDDDTVLTVTFMDNDSVFATLQPTAEDYNTSGVLGLGTTDEFSDNQDTPWYNVPIQGTVYKSIIHNCTTKVRIDPNGNDTWRFNYWVQLKYSDGTQNEYHFDGHALSQSVRENTFQLK